jgi:rubrerythrin
LFEETRLIDRVRKMEEMAEMEEEYAVAYDKNVMGLGNVAIAELMMSVALDSRKHAGLYRAIATILKGSLAITDMEYDQLEESLRRHVEVEARMMEEAKGLMDGEEDDRVKRLLEEIYADEIRHHRFLSTLLEAVVKRDLIFESDVWDMIWRDVPTHGAPRDPYA